VKKKRRAMEQVYFFKSEDVILFPGKRGDEHYIIFVKVIIEEESSVFAK
jgi:hypothetical protein